MKVSIRKLEIKNYGRVTEYKGEYSNGLQIISSQYKDEILSALYLILCYESPNRIIPLVDYEKRVEITAAVNIDEHPFLVEIKEIELNKPRLRVFNQNNTEVTKRYVSLMKQSIENEIADCFTGTGKENYQTKICKFKDCKIYTDEYMKKTTNGLGNTRIFKNFICKYINQYNPERLSNQKEYELCITKEGEFFVCTNNTKEKHLSTSEKTLSNFFSFVNYSSLWSELEQIKDFNHAIKPMIVKDFLEQIDEQEKNGLWKQKVKSINRQVFVFEAKTQG